MFYDNIIDTRRQGGIWFLRPAAGRTARRDGWREKGGDTRGEKGKRVKAKSADR